MWRKSNFELYLAKLRDFMFVHNSLPSFAECLDILGVTSKKSVHYFFQQLIEKWLLTKKDRQYYPTDALMALPFFRSVQAWFPSTTQDESRYDLNVHSYLIERPNKTVLISVMGDSMKDAGIHQWDVVIVEQGREAREGEMVVAIVDDEYTVKYLLKDKRGNPYLRAANDDYPDIHPEAKLEIFGIVVGSFRKY